MSIDNATLELLDEKDSAGRQLFRLTRDFRYRLGPDCVVTVPAGYVTNFGTIPRFAWWWVSPAQLGEGAIVHDWMTNEDMNTEDDELIYSGYTRWLADAVLYEIMATMGFSWIKRFTVWAAVRSSAIWKKAKWPRGPQ